MTWTPPPDLARATGRYTAPEYAVLLADGRPHEPDVVRAALVDALARGALRLEARLVPGRRGEPRQEHLLVAGPTPEAALPAVLRPARTALDACVGVPDADGREGVRVADWTGGLTVDTDGQGYLRGVVRPALVAAGLAEEVRRRMLPGRRWVLTDAGRSFAAQSRDAVEQARAAARPPAAGWDADPAAAAAAVAALGGLGVLALADPGLVAVLVDLRRTVAAGVDTVDTYPFLVSGAGSSGREDDGHHHDHDDHHGPGHHVLDGLGGLDSGGLGAVDAGVGHSGGHSGGHDGWSDGGGGDGGGGDGGGGGGGD